MNKGLLPEMIRACAMLSVLGASPGCAWPFAPRAAKIARESTQLGNWRLDIAQNEFSKGTACRLRSRNHKSFYMGGAVGFRFGSSWSVNQAVYRLDGSEPRTFRDDLPDLVGRGVPLDRGGMSNSTAGIVWIPYQRIVGVNNASIAPMPGRRALAFHLRGLVALHDIALARGCTPESSFVEQ